MRVVFLQGNQPTFQIELNDDQAVAARQYITSLTKNAQAMPQQKETLPPTPQDEERARMNARPSRPVPARPWWAGEGNGTVGSDSGNAIVGQLDDGNQE